MFTRAISYDKIDLLSQEARLRVMRQLTATRGTILDKQFVQLPTLAVISHGQHLTSGVSISHAQLHHQLSCTFLSSVLVRHGPEKFNFIAIIPESNIAIPRSLGASADRS